MANKIFNNERPSNIKPETVFYGKITSGGTFPEPKFTQGSYHNDNMDYGNKNTQIMRDSNITAGRTRKSGINFR